MSTVTIIGAGMMGSALAFPARENGHEVRLVGTPLDNDIIDACKKENRHPRFDRDFPEGISFYLTEEMERAISGADMIIGGVSSFGVDWFSEFVLPRISEDVPILSVTKGLYDLDDGTLLTYPELWEKRLSEMGLKRNINAIGGPCTSYELVAHDMTEVTFCGGETKTLRMLKSIMETDYYHVSISKDVVGVESAVALKNGYALAIALTIGLNQRKFGIDSPLHFNSQAAIFGQAVREMTRLMSIRGTPSIETLAVGFGDLYVTVYGGRTRLIGILLGRGLDIDEAEAELNGVTLESLVVAKRVARAIRVLAQSHKVRVEDFPLLMHVDDILLNKKSPELPWKKFTYEEV